MDDDLCAIFARVSVACSCSAIYGYCLSVDRSVIYGYSLLYSGHYIGSILLLYVADFLLVNIYTLCNGLRNKELRVALVELRRI